MHGPIVPTLWQGVRRQGHRKKGGKDFWKVYEKGPSRSGHDGCRSLFFLGMFRGKPGYLIWNWLLQIWSKRTYLARSRHEMPHVCLPMTSAPLLTPCTFFSCMETHVIYQWGGMQQKRLESNSCGFEISIFYRISEQSGLYLPTMAFLYSTQVCETLLFWGKVAHSAVFID